MDQAMKSGEFIKAFSAAVGIPVPAVNTFFRRLREERLVSTGARGVHAPEISYRDAARMLIAAMVNGLPSAAAEVVKDFGSLRCDPPVTEERADRLSLKCRPSLAPDHTFEDGVAALISIFADDRDTEVYKASTLTLPPAAGLTFLPAAMIEIEIDTTAATIFMPGGRYHYSTGLAQGLAAHEPGLDRPTEEQVAAVDAILAREEELQRRYLSRIRRKVFVVSDVIDDISATFDVEKADG